MECDQGANCCFSVSPITTHKCAKLIHGTPQFYTMLYIFQIYSNFFSKN